MRKPLIAGNWKMYKTTAEALGFAESFKKLYTDAKAQAAVCAPFTQLSALADAFRGTGIMVGAQNVHFEEEGAFTGEISAKMLCEIGVDLCIVGHSERRQYFGETDETVNKKLKKCFAAGIRPILCVGENLEQRNDGKAFCVVEAQIKADLDGISAEDAAKLIIAYEPVWAIGTGRTATPEQAGEICSFIRKTVGGLYGSDTAESLLVQYGGSVKPENVSAIMAMEDIDGALVGGASLKPESFGKLLDF